MLPAIILFVIVGNWLGSVIFWIYPLVMGLIFKDLVFDGWEGPIAKFRLAKKDVEPWHAKLWKDWWGVGLHWFMCYKYPNERGMRHEKAHCSQQLSCGLFWWFIYFGHMLWILVVQKIKGPPYTKHPYLDCVWERGARRAAGQPVDIPPDKWPDGPKDLFPWW
jgi:hypothetical protein